jgi:hypothetical protein
MVSRIFKMQVIKYLKLYHIKFFKKAIIRLAREETTDIMTEFLGHRPIINYELEPEIHVGLNIAPDGSIRLGGYNPDSKIITLCMKRKEITDNKNEWLFVDTLKKMVITDIELISKTIEHEFTHYLVNEIIGNKGRSLDNIKFCSIELEDYIV